MTTARRHYPPASVRVPAGSFSFRFPKIVSGATARDVETGGPAQSGGVRTICNLFGTLKLGGDVFRDRPYWPQSFTSLVRLPLRLLRLIGFHAEDLTEEANRDHGNLNRKHGKPEAHV